MRYYVFFDDACTSFSLPDECSSDSFDIEVFGQNLPTPETYTLALSDTLNFSITFSESTKGKGTVKAGLPLEVQFGKEYSVLNVTKGDDHVLFNQTTFTTPLGPTLSSVSIDWKSSDKKEVTLSLNGERMTSGAHNLTFHEMGQLTPLTLLVTVDTTTTGCGSEVIYGGTTLNYGTTYEVTSLTSDTLHFALTVSLRFTTPDEPSRLVKIASVDDVGFNSTTLTLSSRVLTVNEQYEMKVIGTPLSSSTSSSSLNSLHEATIKFTATSATENTVTLKLYPLEGADVKYGHSYCVDWLKVVGGGSILVETESCGFETPSEPIRLVTFWISGYDSTQVEVKFEMVGRELDTSAMFKVGLSISNALRHLVSMTFDSEKMKWEGSAILFPFNLSQLEYGQRYTVSSFCKDEETKELLFEANEITIEANPSRVTSMAFSSLSDDGKKGLFSVGGRNMKIDERYTIFVYETGTSVQKRIEVTMRTKEEGTGSGVLFSQMEGEIELDFGTEYEVVGVCDSSQLPILFEPNLRFETPSEPTRLVSFWISGYDANEKEVQFEMSGRVLETSAIFKVCLSFSNTVKHTVLMEFDLGRGKWEGSAILYPLDACQLEYGTRYTVSSFRRGDNATELFFEANEITICSEPSRLVKIVRVDDDGLNSTTLTLSSRVLTVDGQYEMKVTGTPLTSSSSSTSSLNSVHETTIKFTATSATENTVRLTLYPLEGAHVKYGHSYCVDWMKVVDGASILVETESCVFETPKEPKRVCSCTGAVLSKDRSQVTISLEGRALAEPLGSIWVSFDNTVWESLSMRRISETSCEADFLVGSTQNGTHLKYEGEYTVCLKPHETSTLLVDSGISVRIPASPSFTKVEFEFTNSLGTGCVAILAGKDLVVGTEYEVTLNTSHTLLIVVTSSSRAESSELLIGFEGSLAHSQNIFINSINPIVDESGLALTPSPFTGKTPARPNVNEMFVDTKTGQNDRRCGDYSNPFSTMDAAWKISQALKISHPTFSLLDSTSLSSPMTIESGMSVLIQNGTNSEPSLNIPTSAAESATSALIVVSSALLNIQNIDIVVGSSNPSFVLISALSSKMILKDGLMTIKSDSGGSRNEMEELCVWRTGLIELIETELNVTNNQFFSISQGAIAMRGGSLKIDGSIFRDNIPSNSPFASARRNIACSESGAIHIGSLAAGDGFKNTSSWISSDGCSIESTEVNPHSPLFIPTLSSDSTSKFDKKAKSFTLTIEGTTLIPCSMFLEVMEIGKDGTEGESTLIPLTIDSATSFTETKIVITIPGLSLNSLDNSLEWRGRLLFGQNQSTTNNFVIQQSSSGRFSQAVKDNMKWWIPLVIVLACVLLALILVVVLVIKHRNRKQTRKGLNEEPQELDQTEDKIEVLKDEGDIEDNQNSVHSVGQKQLNPALTFHDTSSHPSLQNTDKLPTSGGQAAVVIVGEDEFGRPKIEDGFVSPHNTLFDRLHRRKDTIELSIAQARLDLVKAVEKLLKLRPNALALRRLSPHWVLFSPSNSICFKMNEDTPSQPLTTVPTLSGAPKETEEGKRWAAPEEENCENGIDEQKVTVFRLGLILWEMTTGQVPFKETDAVTAQRQLGMGIVPRMDSVEPVELATLLLECLDLNPACRPSVESIVSRLESIGEGKKEDVVDLLDLPNRLPEQPESRQPDSHFQPE
ncbi:hypothetical protein BLNAU_5980 [Blattamonas nauphoetae]|uniref:Protein kinase domain-containing protein n=1 Tax=Blattamonas nauphoetae TaxID=2049346 RepID=A0ABQ9Y5G7_9EUKA|nr:hypothetical protein BLNAU_5980 [Blattamonas nauphoetae]